MSKAATLLKSATGDVATVTATLPRSGITARCCGPGDMNRAGATPIPAGATTEPAPPPAGVARLPAAENCRVTPNGMAPQPSAPPELALKKRTTPGTMCCPLATATAGADAVATISAEARRITPCGMAPAMAGAVPTVATRKQFAGIGVGNPRGTSHGPTASAGPVAPPTGNAMEEAEYKRVTPRYGDGDRWTKACAGNEGAEAGAPGKVDPKGACPGTDNGDEPTATAEREEAAREAAVMICTSSAAPARSMCLAPGRMILHDDILTAGDTARGPVAALKGATTADPMGTVQEAAAAG